MCRNHWMCNAKSWLFIFWMHTNRNSKLDYLSHIWFGISEFFGRLTQLSTVLTPMHIGRQPFGLHFSVVYQNDMRIFEIRHQTIDLNIHLKLCSMLGSILLNVQVILRLCNEWIKYSINRNRFVVECVNLKHWRKDWIWKKREENLMRKLRLS